MNLEINDLIYLGFFSIIIAILYVIHKKSFLKVEDQNRELREKVSDLEQEVKNKNKINTSSSSTNKTSFIASEIKKQESLQVEITKLRKIIENTKKIAQDASMVKSDFLTNIRHEIRTPMNSILVFAQMIVAESQNKKFVTYAQNIADSGNNLLNLFNNIIELSVIESGSFKLSKKAIEIRSFINAVVVEYIHEARKKGLRLSIDIDKTIPEAVMIDSLRVKEILDNLIENAIKYTNHGEVNIFVAQEVFDQVNNEVSISFCVKDTGIGILRNNQEKIFKIFENRESTKDIEYQGTGLGLSINRKLAELMNGTLELRSALNKGSEFTLTLKNIEIVLSNSSQNIDETKIDFSVLKEGSVVVLIDDDKATLEMAKYSFDKTGVELISYFNVRDAMGVLKSKKVDMLIINVDILTMDDGAVSKVIKSISTATVVTLVNSRLINIDFPHDGISPVGHLKKPLQKVELFRMALKVLNTQGLSPNSMGNTEVNTKLGLSFEDDGAYVKEYFKVESKAVNSFLSSVIKTKDLNEITKFGTTISNLSLKYKMSNLNDFANELLEKIDNFDIEAIDDMLNEYKYKSEDFVKR